MADDYPSPDYFEKKESAYEEMLKTMEEKSFFQRIKMMLEGFTKPRDSGEFKLAKQQLELMTSPIIAFLGVTAMVVLMFFIGPSKDAAERAQIAEVIQPETVDAMDEPPPPPDEIQPMEVELDTEFTDVAVNNVTVNAPANTPMSAKPANVNAVMITKSPVMMSGVFGARTTGQIGEARAKFGGSPEVEACVMRSLRWLKMKQAADGSWGGVRPAMTGLAILTFLAHGETPASEEFGDTVRKAIQYLITTQDQNGFFKGEDGNRYAHHIATYALCEAYAMTRNPEVKDAAEKAVIPTIKGQHANGGWDYKIAITDRDDTSVMGWASQSIKAAHNCGDLLSDPEYATIMTTDGRPSSLENAYKLAPKGFLKNFHPEGGFGYTGKSHTSGLSAVGALCMQLMGQGNHDAVKKTLKVMDDWTLGWGGSGAKDSKGNLFKLPAGVPTIKQHVGDGACPQYYAYYATQSMFQAGGDRWKRWNKMMSDVYPKAQIITKKGESKYVDHKGQPQDIGYFQNDDQHSDRPVMDTCLATLQLEVYYRYLPTFKEVKVDDAEIVLGADDEKSVKTTIEW